MREIVTCRGLCLGCFVLTLIGCGGSNESDPAPEATKGVRDVGSPPAEDEDPVGDIVTRLRDDDPPVPNPGDGEPDDPQPGEVFRRSDNRARHDDRRLAALGIRRYDSKRLVLYTDIAPEVARTLPPLVDAAYEHWLEYFGPLPPDRERTEFQITGYLIGDETRFEDAGLVPDDLPVFLNGRHRDYEFWMYEQEHAYYRRHLLLHEATHCFTTCLPNVRMPVWYLEGIAELFATHTLDDEGRLAMRVMPHNRDDFGGLGRITLVQEAVAEGRRLTLRGVADRKTATYLKPESYAWAWAATAFLDGHPRYRDRFRQLGRRVVVEEVPFATAFGEAFAKDRAEIDAEWSLVVDGLRPGYDLERAAVEFRRGEPTIGATCDIRSDRGWQSTAVLVERGKKYEVTATGRFTVADEPRPWISEANGVSLRFVDGRRIGRLLATVRPTEPDERGTAMLNVTPLGNAGVLEPSVTGTLYLRLNDDWGELADNRGEVEVSIRPVANEESAADSTRPPG